MIARCEDEVLVPWVTVDMSADRLLRCSLEDRWAALPGDLESEAGCLGIRASVVVRHEVRVPSGSLAVASPISVSLL